jgi:hypothetical protein
MKVEMTVTLPLVMPVVAQAAKLYGVGASCWNDAWNSRRVAAWSVKAWSQGNGSHFDHALAGEQSSFRDC